MGLIVLEIDTFHLDISDILKIQLANFHLLIKEIWVIKKNKHEKWFLSPYQGCRTCPWLRAIKLLSFVNFV